MNNKIVSHKSKIYQRALRREILVWQKSAEKYKSGIQKNAKMLQISGPNPILIGHDNSKIGIESTSIYGWIDFITKKFKKVDKALSIGSGSGRYEKVFMERGFVEKFDIIDVIKNSLDGQIEDLNFIQMPGNKYDFILCNSILHHIINLEHLLFQLNNALKKDGIIVIKDYVGESKSQWCNERLRILNKKLKSKFGHKYSFLKIKRPPMWNYSPFEGIRSSDIHPIIKKYFGNSTVYEITWNGAVAPIQSHLANIARYETHYFNSFLYNFAILHPRFRQYKDLKNRIDIVNEIFEYAVELDNELDKNELVLPCTLFGIYCKSENIEPIAVKPWTNKQLRYQVNLHLPIFIRIKAYLGRFKYLKNFYLFLKNI